MTTTKFNYDEEADVLYIAFARSEHVIGVELADNIILRLDSGHTTNSPPKAIGLTFISFSYLMAYHQTEPIMVSLTKLRHLPEPLWQAVLSVATTPPVADFLQVGLSLSPQIPPLPEMAMA